MFEKPSGWLSERLHPGRELKLYIRMQSLISSLLDDRGQDLVEYAIVAALISLAAIVGMKSVATALGTAYTHLATKVGTYIT